MITIGPALSRVVDIRPEESRKVRTSTTTVPVLPDRLQRQVDLLIGAVKFADFRMTMPDDAARFDPEAARYAEEMRATFAPAAPEDIRTWLMPIVKSLAPGAISASALFDALMLTCDDLPAGCWGREAQREIVRRHKFLPLAAEFEEVLQPIAKKLRASVAALERMAEAKREPEADWRERKAPEGLAAGRDAPEQAQRGEPLRPTAEDIPAPVRTREQQIAQFESVEADLLAAVRRKYGQ
jgi:hypothetical protein